MHVTLLNLRLVHLISYPLGLRLLCAHYARFYVANSINYAISNTQLIFNWHSYKAHLTC